MIEDSEVCSFADDNNIYAFDDIIEIVVRLFKEDINNALEWFKQAPLEIGGKLGFSLT